METIIKINIDECCTHYSIERSFIEELHDNDILEIWEEDQQYFMAQDALTLLEKSIQFRDMGINVAGIEVIFQLLKKMESLQKEINMLKRW